MTRIDTAARLALVALATARLTRFVTTDWLGEWWLVRPAKRWAHRHETPVTTSAEQRTGESDEAFSRRSSREHEQEIERVFAEDDPDPRNGWRSKLVHGLDCPFCVGFWIGGAVLVAEAVTRRAPRLRKAWTLTAGALALNYLVGHISSRIDQ